MGELRLDGALATTLQRAGLPPRTPVDAWVRDHPDRVRAVHLAFAEAGSVLHFAGTFRMLPSLQPAWRTLAPAAVDLARVPGCRAYASIGPGDGIPDLARLLADRVDGFALETFIDPRALDAAVDAVGPLGRPVAALLVPGDGGRLLDGTDPRPWLDRWTSRGVVVGFNCAPASRVSDALRAWGGPAWARPSDASVGELRSLRGLAVGLGGCCGTGPEILASAWRDGLHRTE